MSPKFDIDLEVLLSDKYDASNASRPKFAEERNTLIKEQVRLREVLKDRNRELQKLG